LAAPNDLPGLPPQFSKRIIRNEAAIETAASLAFRLKYSWGIAQSKRNSFSPLLFSIGVGRGVGNCDQITPI